MPFANTLLGKRCKVLANKKHFILNDKVGEKLLLLGNEAIVRGALESNIAVFSAYPGTPSSEITDTFAEIGEEAGVYVEYSSNEKVAFETSLAASWTGLRSMVAMKHVGLNVAADSFLSSSGMGVDGGFIITVADDPSMWSSQNEQDTRMYARFALVPVFEPHSPQEAKDLVKEAYSLSEKYRHPIIMRMTTRISHMRGEVTLGPLPPEIRRGERKYGEFSKNPERYVNIPAHSRRMHVELLDKIEKIRKELNSLKFNWIEGKGRAGIIASGISYAYVKEALSWLKLGEDEVTILKLSTPYPLPYGITKRFVDSVEKILVVEELEPVVEEQLKVWAYDNGLRLEIASKNLIPRYYEMTTRRALKAISAFMGIKPPIDYSEIDEKYEKIKNKIPPRPPTLCPACPHRSSFYSIRKAASPRAIFPSDIGCYTLGVLPPLKTVDTTIAMGASIGVAHGLDVAINGVGYKKREGKKKVIVATIGDSTFFHTGLPALANSIYNGSDITIVVLDNQVTAMTGHQPHPGTGETPHGPGKKIMIEDVARAMGADYVAVTDPYDIKKTISIIREAISTPGVSVVVARQPCSLYVTSQKRRRGEKWPIYKVIEEKCTGCGICINAFGCPAILWDTSKKKAVINPEMCWGCGQCAVICPYKAIVEEDEK